MAEATADAKRSRLGIVCLVLLSLVLLIIVIVLAAVYGVRLNCSKIDDENESYRIANIPTMTHFPQIKDTKLDTLNDPDGSKSYMKTIAYSLVAGKEMNGGVFRLDIGPPLRYTQWYEGLTAVLSGNLTVTDGTGQSFTATSGDSMYIPAGTSVIYRALTTSFLYYVTQPADPANGVDIQRAMNAVVKPKITRTENFYTAKPNLPLFVNTDNSLSYLKDMIFSNITGKELAGGLYKLLKGPALTYTYTYEEFKYIVEGEFHLTDGRGKFVKAVAGDLMYFPKGTYVHFTSPNHALGFYVGQREPDTA